MRALIIEDDAKTAGYLSKGLGEHGFVVDVAGAGDEGVDLATTMTYDVIILDVMLPGKDGWTVIREVRSKDSAVPILFVTARDSVDDRVKGLELGGDESVVRGGLGAEIADDVQLIDNTEASVGVTSGDLDQGRPFRETGPAAAPFGKD